MRSDTRHVGVATCEGSRTVWAVSSSYARKDEGAAALAAMLGAAAGDLVQVDLYPLGMEEAVREMVDYALADGEGGAWAYGGEVEAVPHAARREAAAREEHERGAAGPEAWPTASALMGALRDAGQACAMSKGGTVWCNACAGDPSMEGFGMRWSAKRGQWWRTYEGAAADAAPVRAVRREQIAAAAMAA